MAEIVPGKFFLGRKYDLEARKILDEPILYKADDLTTHAVCIGMTGSGKTGLGIGLLEEAIQQGLPLLIVDPKGDMTNLFLTFPELRPSDFEPWVDPALAAREGASVADYAAKTAGNWQKGLADWGLGPDDIRRLREKAEFVMFTPGSTAAQPVSILQSFRAPEGGWSGQEEDLRDQISSIVSAILDLVNIKADPLRSREHILLSNLLEYAWQSGQDLDLPTLIQQVQTPPLRKLGVFDLDAFFPSNDRFSLAMVLNGLIAAPAFKTWMEGTPLDIDQFMRAPDGRPRVSLFYLAHLSDAERMFFVTLLLEAVRGWLRRQPGTSSLRSVLYFDELFGFFPPTANPPTKKPLMALLKQARAYGLGLMLTTQNPVDLDYKGLTNAGTWFIGKLQAARDKERLMDGLASIVAEAGGGPSASYLDKAISSLQPRTFLLHNVHDKGGTKIFSTRWVMSYLRGPLTREEVRQLTVNQHVLGEPAPAAAVAASAAAPAATAAVGWAKAPAPAATGRWAGLEEIPPRLPPEIRQFFLRANQTADQVLRDWADSLRRSVRPTESRLLFRAGLLGLAEAFVEDQRKGISHQARVGHVAFGQRGLSSLWADSEQWDIHERDLDIHPPAQALFELVPEAFNEPREIQTQERAFLDHVYRTGRFEVFYNRTLKLYSQVDESEREFRRRVEEAARNLRDDEMGKLQTKLKAQRDKLEQKLQKEERELADDEAEHGARKREEVLSAAESIFNLLRGRSASTAVSKASRRRRYTEKAKMSLEEARESIQRLKDELAELAEVEQKALDEVKEKWAQVVEEVETVTVGVQKSKIHTVAFGLLWVPQWAVTYESLADGSTDTVMLPAFAPDTD
ncbi:MAG: type IV secretion system DNA-binding domain-containing protein [Chloroflexi bacterium]|nr:type IV secretion system DNA-binding domain-containing protein [Chloroflexota bacterium]